MRTARAAALALVVTLLPRAAAAADGPTPLRWRLSVDLPVAAAATAFWVGTEAAKARLAPEACRFCGTNALDAGARELLVWPWPGWARTGSDVLVFGLLPGGMLAHQLLAARAAGDVRQGWVDGLVIAEAAALSMDLNQALKLATGRQRPFVHHLGDGAPERAAQPDDNLSFTSGHATLAFTLAAAAGTVSDLRGYRRAPWVWTAGMTLATATAYLRVAGDRHYLTDVLAGAALGTAAGVALPRLLHPRKDGTAPGAPAAATPLGVAVAF